MGCLFDLYGKRNPDFVRGFLAAIDHYSQYGPERRFIGSERKPTVIALNEAVRDLAEIPEDFKKDIERYSD